MSLEGPEASPTASRCYSALLRKKKKNLSCGSQFPLPLSVPDGQIGATPLFYEGGVGRGGTSANVLIASKRNNNEGAGRLCCCSGGWNSGSWPPAVPWRAEVTDWGVQGGGGVVGAAWGGTNEKRDRFCTCKRLFEERQEVVSPGGLRIHHDVLSHFAEFVRQIQEAEDDKNTLQNTKFFQFPQSPVAHPFRCCPHARSFFKQLGLERVTRQATQRRNRDPKVWEQPLWKVQPDCLHFISFQMDPDGLSSTRKTKQIKPKPICAAAKRRARPRCSIKLDWHLMQHWGFYLVFVFTFLLLRHLLDVYWDSFYRCGWATEAGKG